MGRSAMPSNNTSKNDVVMTPPYLAQQIVDHFWPIGLCLDPCAGQNAFADAMHNFGVLAVHTMEISRNDDFFNVICWKYDWIVSNPPYSILTKWLKHSFEVAENVIYLIQPPAAFFTARLRVAEEAGFGIREIYRVDCPEEWRKAGLSFGAGLGAVWWSKGWTGPITMSDGRKK